MFQTDTMAAGAPLLRKNGIQVCERQENICPVPWWVGGSLILETKNTLTKELVVDARGIPSFLTNNAT